jgi:uncharacterized membrane protein
MRNLSTTIAVYADTSTAELDWAQIETAAQDGTIDLADAALVQRTEDGDVDRLQRHSHHGWGKGAVAGAVVGLLFPPSLLGGAVAGSVGGALIARLNRSLDRGDIKDLGEAMDSGETLLVVVADSASSSAVESALSHATSTVTREGASADEVREAMEATAQPTA